MASAVVAVVSWTIIFYYGMKVHYGQTLTMVFGVGGVLVAMVTILFKERLKIFSEIAILLNISIKVFYPNGGWVTGFGDTCTRTGSVSECPFVYIWE